MLTLVPKSPISRELLERGQIAIYAVGLVLGELRNPHIVVTQTLVEFAGMLVYVRVIPARVLPARTAH